MHCDESLPPDSLSHHTSREAALTALAQAVATGDLAAARRAYRRAAAILETLGDCAGVAAACGELGWLAHSVGEIAEARRLYRRSMTIAQEVGDRSVVAIALHRWGTWPFWRGTMLERAACTGRA